MKIINIYVNLPLSCMQIGQIPAIQMTNVIRCTVLAVQFMCNHRRNVTFLKLAWKMQPAFIATSTWLRKPSVEKMLFL